VWYGGEQSLVVRIRPWAWKPGCGSTRACAPEMRSQHAPATGDRGSGDECKCASRQHCYCAASCTQFICKFRQSKKIHFGVCQAAAHGHENAGVAGVWSNDLPRRSRFSRSKVEPAIEKRQWLGNAFESQHWGRIHRQKGGTSVRKSSERTAAQKLNGDGNENDNDDENERRTTNDDNEQQRRRQRTTTTNVERRSSDENNICKSTFSTMLSTILPHYPRYVNSA